MENKMKKVKFIEYGPDGEESVVTIVEGDSYYISRDVGEDGYTNVYLSVDKVCRILQYTSAKEVTSD